MKKILLILLYLSTFYPLYSQNSVEGQPVVFQKNGKTFLIEPQNNNQAREITNVENLEEKIWEGDVLVRFPEEISEDLKIKDGWVLYTGIQSPHNSNIWLCLERTIVGNDFNLFLFDVSKGSKQVLINNNNSFKGHAFRPNSWSNDKNIVYIERTEFDTGFEHEGLYSYNINSEELKKLNISEKYMSIPLLSPDRNIFTYTVTSQAERDLVHGFGDKLSIYNIKTDEEIILSKEVNSHYQVLGWYSVQQTEKKNIKKKETALNNRAQLNFKLPWEAGITYCVTRDGSNPAPGSPGSSSSCTNLGPHSYPAATDFDTPNNVHHKTLAVAAGTVTTVIYSNSGYGNHIIITHPDNYRTRYAHLYSIAVTQGQQVSQGCYLGIEGTTGNSSGDHLHFEYEYPGGSGNLYANFSDCGGCVPHRGYNYTSINNLQACSPMPPPPPPTVSTNTCGNKTITRATPPSGTTYYWQGTGCGTSTANSSLTYTATVSGTYYLRARSSGGSWSTCSSTWVTVNPFPSTPPVPV
ncbi:MAG: peptidoglycan DD-metalloendopeptidase family protein, partial [Bacteroidota bacterium]|nr:peptidoglycan DD-metalloendopeptidase family protein [Bacteroidota bacterium]